MAEPRLPDPLILPLDKVGDSLRGAAIAIGNFDGMHRGHQALLKTVRDEADARGAKALLLTFDPHPRTLFRPDAPLFQLTPLEAKARLVAALGLDGVVVIPFDRALAATSARDFVERILADRLAASAVVIGHDFHFGHGREGTPAFLAAEGERIGFATKVLSPVADESGAVFSSSRIRADLADARVEPANAALGYRWFATGSVQHGDKRGRELGYPTANIRLPSDCGLALGIYAVTLTRADGTVLPAVASYGRRPTFDNGAVLMEVHVFDFAGDLYGEEVFVTLHAFLRGEERFDSIEALIAQMDRDSLASRRILAEAGPGTGLDRSLALISPAGLVAGEGLIR